MYNLEYLVKDQHSVDDTAQACLKGQPNDIFYLRFFHRWTSLKPLTRYLKTFQI
jgi:hypothetical protein